MKKVLLFSVLLVVGLIISQYLDRLTGDSSITSEIVRVLTMVMLGFIMIHVGYEFEIDRSKMKSYGFDYLVAATSAAFPWIFCAAYFVFFLFDPGEWNSFDTWTGALLTGRFAAQCASVT